MLFCKFIQSIPDNQLVRQKLNCMTKIVESSLFQQPGKPPLRTVALGEGVRLAVLGHMCARVVVTEKVSVSGTSFLYPPVRLVQIRFIYFDK